MEETSETKQQKIVLYSSWRSSCSWRVRFALILKGLDYHYRAVSSSDDEEFVKLNPLRYVPVLVDGDVVVSDSFAILLYLEDKYPERALLPRDARLRALNFQASSTIHSNIQPLHSLSILKRIEDLSGSEERILFAESNIEKGFLALEKLLKDSAGKFATGDKLYMADVFLAPQIAVAVRRFNIDMSKFPRLSHMHESYKALPEFIASSPENQPDAKHDVKF